MNCTHGGQPERFTGEPPAVFVREMHVFSNQPVCFVKFSCPAPLCGSHVDKVEDLSHHRPPKFNEFKGIVGWSAFARLELENIKAYRQG